MATSPSGLAGPAHSCRCPSLVPRVPNSKPHCQPIPIRGTSAGAGQPPRGHSEHGPGLHRGSWHVSLLSPSSRELLCGPGWDPGLASDSGMLQHRETGGRWRRSPQWGKRREKPNSGPKQSAFVLLPESERGRLPAAPLLGAASLFFRVLSRCWNITRARS